MEFGLEIMIFVLGLCCGSFVNMLAYRVAIDYGLEKKKFKVKNKNRSFCDYCGRQLKWYENMPVISWVIQRGKTRCCGKKLSILYPIVEIVTGLLFLMVWFFGAIYESPLHLVLSLVIITFLVFSTVFDLKYMILPDFSTVILIGCSVILVFLGAIHESPLHLVIAAVSSFSFLGLLNLITEGKGMGWGDVKLAGFMGLFLGIKMVIVAFYVAFITGAFVGLALMISKKANRKTLVPFGPFLIFGTLLAWFWGSQIMNLSVFQFVR